MLSYYCTHQFKYIFLITYITTEIFNLFLGDDGVKMLKDGDEKPNVPSSMIAEEAVDQLQASEKLIAGILYLLMFSNFKTWMQADHIILQNCLSIDS